MKITAENAKEFAHNVMSKKDVDGFNKLNGTHYESKEELLDNESAENVAEFYQWTSQMRPPRIAVGGPNNPQPRRSPGRGGGSETRRDTTT